jgi:hypothetical protein
MHKFYLNKFHCVPNVQTVPLVLAVPEGYSDQYDRDRNFPLFPETKEPGNTEQAELF